MVNNENYRNGLICNPFLHLFLSEEKFLPIFSSSYKHNLSDNEVLLLFKEDCFDLMTKCLMVKSKEVIENIEPNICGIYILIDADLSVVYAGQSRICVKSRLRYHYNTKSFAYLFFFEESKELLNLQEAKTIFLYAPKLCKTIPPNEFIIDLDRIFMKSRVSVQAFCHYLEIKNIYTQKIGALTYASIYNFYDLYNISNSFVGNKPIKMQLEDLKSCLNADFNAKIENHLSLTDFINQVNR